MANQQRLADNLNRYEADRHGVSRRGNAHGMRVWVAFRIASPQAMSQAYHHVVSSLSG
jgi:hypothetical protein